MTRARFPCVLLIAPEPMVRRTLRPALLSAGVGKILEAGSGAEALTQLGTELVDLALTPWELPDMAGRPLLHALRNRGRNRNVPVVVLDGGMPQASVIASVKAGAAGRLTLPANPQAVRTLLEQVATDRSGGSEQPPA